MPSIQKATPQAIVCSLVVAFLTVIPAYGWDTYSGSSVGSDGTTYGWGVTNAPQAGYLHTAYVTTTLTSPNGRTHSVYWKSATTSVRADVWLLWDPTDEGTYLTSSTHKAYCRYMGWFMYNIHSSSSLEIGKSHNWYWFYRYDEAESPPWVFLIYFPCETSCKSSQWNSSYRWYNNLETHYYWWRWGSGTRHCLFEIEYQQSPAGGSQSCRDTD